MGFILALKCGWLTRTRLLFEKRQPFCGHCIPIDSKSAKPFSSTFKKVFIPITEPNDTEPLGGNRALFKRRKKPPIMEDQT